MATNESAKNSRWVSSCDEFVQCTLLSSNPISRFIISGAHAHWVGSLDTPSHATKEKKCANETGSLITLLIDF